EFNKQIVDATAQYVVAYKPNIAFYEARGVDGWQSLEKIVEYIKNKYPEIFLIADAKRGDIGNTSNMYAKAFFENMKFDAITLAPYMGEDSVSPFLVYKDKWVVLLALTSNNSAKDFQLLEINNTSNKLYYNVIEKSSAWGSSNNLMYVVGATKAEKLKEIREIIPDNFLLIPGVGAQGGSLSEVAKYGMNSKCGLLVNSSRGIIYADSTDKFPQAAANKASELQKEMKTLLSDIL
ncbi:MAG: orotidine-5'-phosphate decarboxylase, partial [Bacteroidota bacterium]|nr:orotidine-5'-phosphate decarboxylase [Bacteroidota bacterium]